MIYIEKLILKQHLPQELIHVKNKRSKNSIFYDSTKNKRRRQEGKHNLQVFDTKNFTNSEKSTFSIGEKRNFHSKNGKSNYRNHTTIAPFFTSDDMPSFEADSLSRPEYTYKKDEPKRSYIYGFTDSRFIYFLGNLSPKEYLLFVTIVGLLIVEDLNETEAKIIFAFLSNVTDTIQTVVEQEVILSKYKHNKEARDLNNALHHDFETIYAELDRIRKRLPK